MISFKSMLFVAIAIALGALSGCSTTQSDGPRQLDVTLVGGSHVNVSRTGESRPVEVCIYLVQSANWSPSETGDAPCAARGFDVVASTRHVIAPNQLQQFALQAPRTGELWLVVDADYAERPAKYAPLRVHVDGRGLIHLAVWVDRAGIFDALKPGPVPVTAVEGASPATGAGSKKKIAPPPNRSSRGAGVSVSGEGS